MLPSFIKTTASTLNKIANLPRYRHPADLLNMEVQPMSKQLN